VFAYTNTLFHIQGRVMKMKTTIASRTLAVLTVALALSLVFAGCPNNDPDPVKTPPKNISVTKGGTAISLLEIDKDDTASLTVSATGATSYYWEAEEGVGKVELSPVTGATTTVTGVRVGTAKIIAYAANKDGPISKEITVTVTNPDLPGLILTIKDGANKEVGQQALPLNKDSNLTLTAGVTADDASTVVSPVISWAITTGNTFVDLSATTGTSVTITGKAAGNATVTITATKEDYKNAIKTVHFTVSDPNLQTLTLTIKDEDAVEIEDGDEIEMEVDEERNLTATASEAGATIAWDSEDPLVATVTDGTITAIGDGETTVTVTAEKANFNPATKIITIKVALKPTLELTVSSGGTGTWVTDTLTINTADTLTLGVTGKVDGSPVTLTSTAWAVTSGNDIVSIIGVGATGVVTVLKHGTAEIKVTASAAGVDPAEKNITLVVERQTPTYDPDVIFEWDLSDIKFKEIATSMKSSAFAGGTPGNNTTDPCILQSSQGSVTHPDFPGITLRSYGTELPYNSYTGEKGFRLGGYTNSGGPRFVIGQSSNHATTADDTVTTNIYGQIDLSKRKVKVTIGYADIVDSSGRYKLRIAVNNNTGTATNSNLDPNSTIKQFHWSGTSGDNVYIETDAVSGTNFVKQGSTKTAGELYATIDPTQFASNPNKDALKNAFIMLHAQNLAAANADNTFAEGNWITITYIKVEYTGGVVVQDPVPLTIKDDGTEIEYGTTIATLDIATASTTKAIPLTAETGAVTGATVSWEVTSGGTFVELSATTGTSVTITGKAAGTANIRVGAAATGYDTTYKTFSVKVEDSSTAVNPLIWEWKNSTQAWANLTTTATFATTAYPLINLKAYGATVGPDTVESVVKGMRIGGAANSGGQRLAIGYNSGTATSGDDTAAYAGQIDFSKKTKVTVDYENVVQFGTRVVLRVSLNNNTNTSTNSNIGASSQIGNYTATQLQTASGSSSATSGTLEITINPSSFTAAQQTLLKTGFLGIHCQHDGNASGTGNWITISRIRIEYVD
jgi:hypothetical protein